MKIQFNQPNTPYESELDTRAMFVTIKEAYTGPIFTHGNANLSVMMRDDGFEINFWEGSPKHNEPLPADAKQFSVNRRGIYVPSHSCPVTIH